MEAMNCKACRIEIEEALAHEPLSARARSHAETCQPCGAFLVEHESLMRLVGSLEAVVAPPDFDFRLRARLGAAGREESRGLTLWPRFAPRMSALLALAASLALLIGAWAIFRQVNFNRQATALTNETVATVPANNAQTNQLVSVPPSIERVDSSVEDRPSHHNDNARRNLTATSRRGTSVDVSTERQPGVEPTGTATATADSGIRSIDFGALRPAPQLYPTGISNPAVDPNPAIIVPVRALAQSAKFLFDKGRGTASPVFSLRNVTFGSEKLIDGGEPSGATEQDATDIW